MLLRHFVLQYKGMIRLDLRGQGLVTALVIVQIFAWGSTYYLLAVLAEPILRDTGWSRIGVMGGCHWGCWWQDWRRGASAGWSSAMADAG